MIVLMLTMILVFGNIMSVSAEQLSFSSAFGSSLQGNLFFTRIDNMHTGNPITTHIYFGTSETLSDTTGVLCYPVYSDFSEYLTTEVKRVIGFFFVSEKELINVGLSYCEGEYKESNISSTSNFSINTKLKDYKTLSSYGSYWKDYLSQFDINEENYQDFYDTYKDYYFGYTAYSTGYDSVRSQYNAEYSSGDLYIYPLNKDGSKYDDDSISTLCSETFFPQGPELYFAPFLYSNKYTPPNGFGDGDGDGNYDNFICYVNVTQVFYNLSLRNKMRFYWDVSKYPQFKNGFIELRAFPYNEAAKINEVDDAYWFSSLTLSNKKENQKYFSLGNFDDGEYIAIDYYLDDYYQNFLEKFSEIIAPYNSGNYRFQLRVCDSEKNVRTNWITFDLDDVQREYSSSILDPNGNVVDDNVYDNEDFDSDFRDKGQTSDIYDKNDPDNNRLNDITDI